MRHHLWSPPDSSSEHSHWEFLSEPSPCQRTLPMRLNSFATFAAGSLSLNLALVYISAMCEGNCIRSCRVSQKAANWPPHQTYQLSGLFPLIIGECKYGPNLHCVCLFRCICILVLHGVCRHRLRSAHTQTQLCPNLCTAKSLLLWMA